LAQCFLRLNIGAPAIGGGDGVIQRSMRLNKPARPFVIKSGKRALNGKRCF
jgi:hypothetical protein